MAFTRISMLGATGLVVLGLSACSASDSPTASRSDGKTERVDSDTNRTDLGQQTESGTESPCAEPLDLEKLKWLNKLEKPRVFQATAGHDEAGRDRDEYRISARQTQVQMLPPGCKPTTVLAYGGPTRKADGTDLADTWDSPGATFEMKRGTPARVVWVNEIKTPHLFDVDPTLHWANPNKVPAPTGPFGENFQLEPEVKALVQAPVPIVTHVHGLEVGSESDGHPEAWFTATGKPGPAFNDPKAEDPSFQRFDYPNSQPATTLWYHDHALGVTRLNVYAGLAGMYIIRDPADEFENPSPGAAGLPDREHEMPLVIQDKTFNSDGSLVYTSQASDDHPYWSGFFGGATYVVNGKVWPVMQVERTRYRFRMLNGGNNGTLQLSLPESLEPLKNWRLTVIGSDGGYLAKPADAELVRLAPGERADVVIDFTDLEPGKSLTLSNQGVDVVRFTVPDAAPKVASRALPLQLDTSEVALTPGPDKRTVTLHPAPDNGYLLNGQHYHDKPTELPVIGSTEDWDIVNISGDDHPIHLHLVQFKIIQRRQLDDVAAYQTAWKDANGGGALPLSNPAQNPDADAFLRDESKMDDFSKETAKILATESGWKDTAIAPNGFVTRIRVRWAPQEAPASTSSGSNPFAAFDPTLEPGYVWHCHMLEHEDNDMMRPLKLAPTATVSSYNE
jgi:FtsP/CotA-like multicopper oxidase with cupredoxin domain